MEILNNNFELNNIILVVFINKNGNADIRSGRLFDYDKDSIWLDGSYDFWQLNEEEIYEIKRDCITFVKRLDNEYWR